MKNTFVITLCALPLAFATAAYAQGPSGRSGSGDQSGNTEASSTNPSALGGYGNQTQSSDAQPAPRTDPQPAPATRPTDPNTGINRSSSGNDKGTPQSNMPGHTSNDASSNTPNNDDLDSQASSRSAGAAKPSVSPTPSTNSGSGTKTNVR